jgi:TolB-like protein
MPKKSLTRILPLSLKCSFFAISVASLTGCILTQEPSIPIGRYADDVPLEALVSSKSDPAHSEHSSEFSEEFTDEVFDEFATEVSAEEPTGQIDIEADTHTPLLYTINDYVRNLTQDLVANMENITSLTPMGITHFAWLDSDLNQSNIMALQMAEGFKHEFHQYRIPVVDFKSTGFIRVTAQGDFYLSRDHEDLNIDVPMDYILTGTFALHHGGVLINARILDVSTKHIVASAQSLIPEHIANAVMVSYENVIGEHLGLLGLPLQDRRLQN